MCIRDSPHPAPKQERSSARPAPLCLELTQWGRSLGAESAILQLVRDLDAAAAGGGGGGGGGATVALAREASWQQSCGRFLHGLSNSYAGYPDVVLPLQLALGQARHGVRLLACLAAPTAIAVQEGRAPAAADAPAALLRCLLEFPQPCLLPPPAAPAAAPAAPAAPAAVAAPAAPAAAAPAAAAATIDLVALSLIHI